MIVSHQHRFIFLKTRKTAGTSVEIALSRHCGPDDIITPIDVTDEKTRMVSGGRGPQNTKFPIGRWGLGDWRTFATQHKTPTAYHHMPLTHVRAHLSRDVWDSYFKFSIVRNPWDAQMSAYHWFGGEGSFSDFIGTGNSQLIANNTRLYCDDNDRIAVDKVCRYETLTADLAEVTDRLGLPGLKLPQAKRGTRPDRPAAYSDTDVEAVAQLSRLEIDLFGYEFPAALALTD